jgi:hypothetical protein
MTKEEKKELIESLIRQGDVRSYNELRADLELEIWTAKQKNIMDFEFLKLKKK